jgi:Flp pilus assembly pilin Flp
MPSADFGRRWRARRNGIARLRDEGGRKRALTPQPFLNHAFTIRGAEVNAAGLWFRAEHPTGVLGEVRRVHQLIRGFQCMESIRKFVRDEDGQDVVEYGLLIATIAIVVLIGVGFFGSSINVWFQRLAGRITTTGTT